MEVKKGDYLTKEFEGNFSIWKIHSVTNDIISVLFVGGIFSDAAFNIPIPIRKKHFNEWNPRKSTEIEVLLYGN